MYGIVEMNGWRVKWNEKENCRKLQKQKQGGRWKEFEGEVKF